MSYQKIIHNCHIIIITMETSTVM